jgi:hypothetical protein
MVFKYCELLEIKQNILKKYPSLMRLSLEANMIEILEKDLFKFNPDLRMIKLSQNNIKHIDPNVFDHLKHLHLLDLKVNACYGINAYTRERVLKNIANLDENKTFFCAKFEESKILGKKKAQKFNWKKYFWVILIFCTTFGLLVIYGIFKIFMNVKVFPLNQN